MEMRSSASSSSLLQSHCNELGYRARALFEAEDIAPSLVRVLSALSRLFGRLRGFFFTRLPLFVLTV